MFPRSYFPRAYFPGAYYPVLAEGGAPAILPGLTAVLELSDGAIGWTDLTADLIRDSLVWSRGIFGAGPLDRLARPGTLTFTLDNTNQNSAATFGYYSPDHPDVLPTFVRGAWVRLRLSDGTNTRYVFRGRLRTITADPGVAGLRTTRCIASDWLADFADFDAADLALQESVAADALLTTLIGALPAPPVNVDFDPGLEAYLFAFDDLGGDTPKALQLANDIVMSEMGFLYLRGDTTDGETLRFENRHARAMADVAVTITREQIVNEPGAFAVPALFESIINEADVRTVPRRVDPAATTVLIQLATPIEVSAGATAQIFVDYRDPENEAEFVGGKNMVQPAATTDWTANTQADGGGSDVTGSFTVVASYFGSRAMLEITNAGGSVGFVRGLSGTDGLRARGRGIYRYSPVTSRAVNAASVALFGRRPMPQPLTMPYQSDQNVGQGIGEFIVNLYGGDLFPTRVRLLTEADEDLLEHAILRDIGDLVGFTEAQTGMDAIGTFIDGIEQQLSLSGRLTTWWTLAPADRTNVLIFDEGRFDEHVFGFA